MLNLMRDECTQAIEMMFIVWNDVHCLCSVLSVSRL